MDIEELREFALSFKAVEESFPFDEHTLVFKVMNKIFLMASLDEQPQRFNFKALPELGEKYREDYHSVIPGYHSNKKHWNTVRVYKRELPSKFVLELIDHSYDMVVKSMPKKLRVQLEEASGGS